MISISKTIKEKVPNFSYEKIANKVLGKKYELSLVFIGRTRMQTLNQSYRRQSRPTDVLSFPLNKQSGEIFICPEVARQKAGGFGLTSKQFIGYLFIHGLLHLKGEHHSSKMNKAEVKLCRAFNLTKPGN